jgi:Bacterial Alpha-2-macroglobulin MG10 domain
VESQAQMIAAFAEIDQDTTILNDCRDWLIQQRRNGDWGTTTATTAAVRALLTGAGSENVLADDELAHVDLAGKELVAQNVEAGTGFYECRIPANAIKAEMADLTMRKKTPGVAWASVHWSYFEDVAKVGQSSSGGLQLEKQLLVKRTTAKGPTETIVAGPLQPGDEMITRLIITTDRDLEFLHLKDQRGSGTEPISVHSGRRWFDSFNCYESTRDSATHFYIDSLSKGIHVIEYSTRVQHAGSYQSGIATLTCMYAPEFQARSASVRIEVKPMEEK